MKSITLFFLCLFLMFFAQAQDEAIKNKKTFQAVRTNASIRIDGKDEEAAWMTAPILTDFRQWQGENVGEPSISKTEVRVLYSDEAIYVFARNFDKREDVRRELSERDGIGNAGFFGFFFDPFLSEIEGFEFIVSTAGTQFDAKFSANGEDEDWDAVWDSKVIIGDNSWTAEMKIPFSALRFPTKGIQNWGVNFFRRIQRTKEKSSWNFIDANIDGFVNQAGIMEGIKNIDAPIRLSATPFISFGMRTGPNGNQYSYGGGGDLKLGLSNAFTLDLTVIPDFSQTRSDEAIVNISPFEIFYSERRPFFTEGTDLFEKGDIIYTRRIGNRPLNYSNAFSSKKIKDNPEKSQLINAVKLSGRTNKKLGIGFLNAVEARTFATYQDGSKFQTNPLTNYNVFVFDQQLKNNSSVAIINSNVFREGEDYDANVTALDYTLNTKSRKWGTSGIASLSQIILSDEDNTIGHKLELDGGRQSGKFTYSLNYIEISDTYNPNDFGFEQNNNSRNIYVRSNYHENKPKHLRNYNVNFSFGTERLYKPNTFVESWVNSNLHITTKKFLSLGVGFFLRPVHGKDFYESRTPGRFYKTAKVVNLWLFSSTDYNKKLALDFHGSTGKSSYQAILGNISLGLRYRFSDKFSSRISSNYRWSKATDGFIYKDVSSIGYNELNTKDIIFGKRNRKTLVSSLSASFKINNNMTCSFFARNYWTQIETNDFNLLALDGSLTETPYRGKNNEGISLHDFTQDYFNIDFVYRWHFSPGSDLYFTWKNVADGGLQEIFSFGDTLEETFIGEKNNSITLKMLYYLDYNSLRKKDHSL